MGITFFLSLLCNDCCLGSFCDWDCIVVSGFFIVGGETDCFFGDTGDMFVSGGAVTTPLGISVMTRLSGLNNSKSSELLNIGFLEERPTEILA